MTISSNYQFVRFDSHKCNIPTIKDQFNNFTPSSTFTQKGDKKQAYCSDDVRQCFITAILLSYRGVMRPLNGHLKPL